MKSLLLLLASSSSHLMVSANSYDWRCNLFCFNEGECQHGKGKFGSYAGVGDEVELPWEQTTEASKGQNGMFCKCPIGFTGLQCEIKLVVCGLEQEHTCFNGSQCKKERSGDGSIYYRCECDSENSVLDAKYAGKYCEHIATTFCGKDGGSSEKYDGGGGSSFCANGGRCIGGADQEDSTKHLGCECPDGWEGAHCEVSTFNSFDLHTLARGATSKSAVTIVLVTLAALVFAGTALCFWADRREKKRQQRYRMEMGDLRPSPFSDEGII